MLQGGFTKQTKVRSRCSNITDRNTNARPDLRAAIKIEPATAAITQELSKVTEALKTSKAAKVRINVCYLVTSEVDLQRRVNSHWIFLL